MEAEDSDWKSEALTGAPADSRGDAIALSKELGAKLTEESLVSMPKLLSFLKHDDPVVIRQTIATGTSLFSGVLKEMTLQLHKSGKVEAWLDTMWAWMVQFKDTVSGIVLEHGSAGTKVFAIKFIEVCVKLFSSGTGESPLPFVEGEGDRTLGFLLDILQSTSTNCGFFTIAVINSLSAIARSRPLHYNRILSSLLAIDPKFETLRGGHAPSLRYALKACVVGFLRCTHPLMVESREKLLRALRATNPGDATEQIIRQMEKMSKSMERASCDVRVSKDDLPSGQIFTCEDMIKKRPIAQANDTPVFDGLPAKRAHYLTPVISSQYDQFASDTQDQVASNEFSSDTSVTDSNLNPAEKMITMIGALLGEGDRGVESLELLLSNIHADLLADIVIETMKHLPSGPPGPSSRHRNLPINSHATSATVSSQRSPDSATSVQASALSSLITSVAADASGISLSSSDMPSTSDMPSLHTLLADSKRDPRRDCHYLNPRQVAEPVDQHSLPLNLEINNEMLSDVSYSLSQPSPASELIMNVEESPVCLLPNKESVLSGRSVELLTDHPTSKESLDVWDGVTEAEVSLEVPQTLNSALPLVQDLDEEVSASNQLDISENEGVDDMLESDHCSSTVSTTSVSDDICHDFPVLPLYVDLTDDQKNKLCKLTVSRIIEGYHQVRATGHGQARLPLLARLVAQADADDHIIMLLQKHIILDYHHQKATSQETSISSSQNTEHGASESESTKGIQADDQSDRTISFSHAQQQTSLFFALCTLHEEA